MRLDILIAVDSLKLPQNPGKATYYYYHHFLLAILLLDGCLFCFLNFEQLQGDDKLKVAENSIFTFQYHSTC